MNEEITPKPWEWQYLDGRRVRLSTRSGDVFTAALTDVNGFPYVDIGEADAALIAAAPDLLKAAQKAIAEMCNTNSPRTSFTDAVDALDAAITKAKQIYSIKPQST